jgi:hypothetical protein
MAGDFYAGQLVKGAMRNMITNEEIAFQFNPNQLSKSLSVNYARHKPIGNSHDVLHYQSTGNTTIPLTLMFSLAAYVDLHRGAGTGRLSEAALRQILIDFEDQRNFFVSLCYPAGRASDPLRRAPPTALLLWPKSVAMEVVVTRYQDTDTQFNLQQDTRMFSVQLALEEYRRWRLTSSMARKAGFKRHGDGPRF